MEMTIKDLRKLASINLDDIVEKISKVEGVTDNHWLIISDDFTTAQISSDCSAVLAQMEEEDPFDPYYEYLGDLEDVMG